MSRLAPGIALAALALLALASPARADVPFEDARWGRVRIGWSGWTAPGSGVSPVTLFLRNPEPRPVSVTATLVSWYQGGGSVTVSLPPGAERRVALVARVPHGAVVVLSEERRAITRAQAWSPSNVPGGAILGVDGDPAALQVAALVPGVATIACEPDELTGEVATLLPFRAVVLRSVTLEALPADARGALEDYVRLGGLVVACGPGARETFDAWPGEPSRRPEGPFPEKEHGLGRVLLAPADLGRATPEGFAVRLALGPRLALARTVAFPVAALREPRPAQSGARGAGAIVGAHVALYALVVAPVAWFFLRRARPRRVVVAQAIAVAAFLALAVVAGLVAAGRARTGVVVASLTLVRDDGSALVFADVEVAGWRATTLELEGDALAATTFGPDVRRAGGTRRSGLAGAPPSVEFTTTTTHRAPRGERTLVLPPVVAPAFGTASVSIIASARVPRIRARVERVAKRLVAIVENDSDRDLERVLVHETPLGFDLPYAFFERIPARTRATAAFEKHGASGSVLGLERSRELLADLERATFGIATDRPHFVLIAPDAPAVRVRARDQRVLERAFRLQSVESPPASEPGYLGIQVAATLTGARIVNVDRAFPLVKNGLFRLNQVLLRIDGEPILDQADLDRALARAGTEHAADVEWPGGSTALRPRPVPPAADVSWIASSTPGAPR